MSPTDQIPPPSGALGELMEALDLGSLTEERVKEIFKGAGVEWPEGLRGLPSNSFKTKREDGVYFYLGEKQIFYLKRDGVNFNLRISNQPLAKDVLPIFSELEGWPDKENIIVPSVRNDIKGRLTLGSHTNDKKRFSPDLSKRSVEVTNESIVAIVGALEPNDQDKILSICGTGDIPLALSEFGCHVDAVDLDPNKIRLAKENLKLLEDGDFNSFLSVGMEAFRGEASRRNAYFSKGKARIKAIRSNLSNIKIRRQGILEALNDNSYTKVWLSNIMVYKDQDYEFGSRILQALSGSLEIGGLFYSTNGPATQNYLEKAYDEGLIPRGTFVLDEEKTKKAQGREKHDNETFLEFKGQSHTYDWQPQVYRRVT